MTFLEWFLDLGWRVYGLLASVLAIAGALGAWFGGREAEAALYAGQAPTLAELRAQVQRLRRWLALLTRWPAPPGGAETALQELEALGRNLRDLAPPSRRRLPSRPLGVPPLLPESRPGAESSSSPENPPADQ